MPPRAPRFVCQSCGAIAPRWAGRCESCGEWNTIAEETPARTATALARPATSHAGPHAGPGGTSALAIAGLQGAAAPPPRIPTTIAELDRVLGGGLVPGAAILVGGDPGIGKSTLLLQAAAALSAQGRQVLYVSGEESLDQVRLRARRLALGHAPLQLAASTDLRAIAAHLDTADPPALAVIDSIQTMWLDSNDSAPGTVTQVRACSFELIRLAKARGFTLVLVGHVTKDGAIAGPRVLEHMVDAVLYFEGERGHQFRILRGNKNRFGATDEIGVFKMTGAGLAEVANPSALFLAERRGNIAGSAVFAGLEGSRPVLVEIQALLAPNPAGSPRRSVVGWDQGRLSMLLAVLETRCGLRLAASDVYLNIAGGLRIGEPAADLAVAAALVSAATSIPTAAQEVFFGEVGLSGEIRQIPQAEARLKEAAKLGFAAASLPARATRASTPGLQLHETGHLRDLVARFAAP